MFRGKMFYQDCLFHDLNIANCVRGKRRRDSKDEDLIEHTRKEHKDTEELSVPLHSYYGLLAMSLTICSPTNENVAPRTYPNINPSQEPTITGDSSLEQTESQAGREVNDIVISTKRCCR